MNEGVEINQAKDKILDGRTKKQLVMEKYIMYNPKRSMRKNKPVEQRIVTPQALLNIFWGRESN